MSIWFKYGSMWLRIARLDYKFKGCLLTCLRNRDLRADSLFDCFLLCLFSSLSSWIHIQTHTQKRITSFHIKNNESCERILIFLHIWNWLRLVQPDHTHWCSRPILKNYFALNTLKLYISITHSLPYGGVTPNSSMPFLSSPSPIQFIFKFPFRQCNFIVLLN